MKNFKCIECFNESKYFTFDNGICVFRCAETNHHFFKFEMSKDLELLEFCFIIYNNQGNPDICLEFYENVYNQVTYFFYENSIYKKIYLEYEILNLIKEKIINNSLTKEYVVEIINKLQDLMLFL